jgi:hypothetical protein
VLALVVVQQAWVGWQEAGAQGGYVRHWVAAVTRGRPDGWTTSLPAAELGGLTGLEAEIVSRSGERWSGSVLQLDTSDDGCVCGALELAGTSDWWRGARLELRRHYP